MCLKRNVISVVFLVILLIFAISLISCASIKMKSSMIVTEDFKKDFIKNNEKPSFFMLPVKVKAFKFYEEKEIAYIMDKKIRFNFIKIDNIVLHSSREKTDLLIQPELIIKPFESNYTEKNFYMLSVKVLDDGATKAEMNCEYNGPLSIFDANVQNGMIRHIMSEFRKWIK